MIKGTFQVGRSAPATPTPAPPPTCYGALEAMVSDEGTEVGYLPTSSSENCKDACALNSQCKSFSFCPQWSGCWFKARAITGNEAVVSNGDCKTYYKKSCDSSGSTESRTPPPVPSPTRTPTPRSSSPTAPVDSSSPSFKPQPCDWGDELHSAVATTFVWGDNSC